ncbi:hypothetical protein VTN02DRAFT_4726 [Thermoascus thermophilus]
MRLFLIPISTRRALIYSQPLSKQLSKNLSIHDRITIKAAETWAKWEESQSGWKKFLVKFGNRVQESIPFEEWGLKSVPPLNARRATEEAHQEKRVEVLFPGNAIKPDTILGELRKIATERQDLHRRRMWWSFIIAPLTAPIALIPLIPNIPFFYLAYRGWSHWRALNGSRHLEFLLNKGLLNPISVPELERFYSPRLVASDGETKVGGASSGSVHHTEKKDEKRLLGEPDGKELGKILNAPELAVEVERAVAQVRERLESKGQLVEEIKERNASGEKQKEKA